MDSATPPWFLIIPVMVLCGLLTVATVVGTVLLLAGRPRSGVRRVGGSLAMVCGGMLSVIVLLGIVLSVGISVPVMQQSRELHRRDSVQRNLRKLGEQLHDQQHKQGPSVKRLPEENSTIKPADALVPLTGHAERTAVTAEAAARPQWTETPLATQGDVTLIVISGQQFATIEEARQDVAVAARQQVFADFEKAYRTTSTGLRRLSDETLRTLAVRNEFVETVDRDFGNFTAPMHRVWWQVELSPAVRSELYPQWRAKEQEIRTLVVAGNLALVTMGLAIVSWFTRRKPVIPPAPAVTNPVILGIGAATLFAQRCRQWWR